MFSNNPIQTKDDTVVPQHVCPKIAIKIKIKKQKNSFCNTCVNFEPFKVNFTDFFLLKNKN